MEFAMYKAMMSWFEPIFMFTIESFIILMTVGLVVFVWVIAGLGIRWCWRSIMGTHPVEEEPEQESKTYYVVETVDVDGMSCYVRFGSNSSQDVSLYESPTMFLTLNMALERAATYFADGDYWAIRPVTMTLGEPV